MHEEGKDSWVRCVSEPRLRRHIDQDLSRGIFRYAWGMARRPSFTGACLAAALLTVCATPALAVDSMRCGSRLITQGDGKDKVYALCGEPSAISVHGFVRRAPRYEYGRGYHRYDWYGPSFVDLPVEIWTYNFGSHKLLHKLRFVGDELEEIETAGYGY